MKKITNFPKKLMMTILFAAVLITPLQVKSQNYSYQQLQQTADDGQSAVNSNSHEGASWYASQNFDTQSTSPPAVDLSGAGSHPTVQLLRNSDDSNPYTPQRYRSLHTTPPPMP